MEGKLQRVMSSIKFIPTSKHKLKPKQDQGKNNIATNFLKYYKFQFIFILLHAETSLHTSCVVIQLNFVLLNHAKYSLLACIYMKTEITSNQTMAISIKIICEKYWSDFK